MPFVGIGVRVGGNSARTSYAKQLAKAYAARVIADGGVVESLGCFTAFAKALGASKPTFDADYQAVLDYATTQGYTLPSAGQQTLQNQLVVDLKDGGIWSKLDTFAVFATDGDSDFALIDWKRLSDYTAFNSPTFTTNQGFQGDATSAYIDSNFNILNDSVNMLVDDASLGAYVFTAQTIGAEILGTDDSVNRMRNSSTVLQRVLSGSNAATNIDLSGTGLISGYKNSPSNWTFYKDNVQKFNGSFTSGIKSAKTLYFLTHNGSSSFTNAELSVGFGGASLESEHTDFYNSIDSYITSL
jgi:hypothetical protein